jgi:TPP-dependent pyruvate/acetoin dehydrogenase alpha subunit
LSQRTAPVTDERRSPDDHLALFRKMVAIRHFEDRAEKLHHDGFIVGPFHSSAGQEAVAVGVGAALRTDDVVTSTHRGHGHLIGKGADLAKMWAELRGAEAGYCGGLGGSMHIVDMSIGAIGENGIIGASVYLATGAALGFQQQGVDRVAVAFTGDGSLAQGVLFECITLAGIWDLPVVFVVEDNKYAHSFPSGRLRIKDPDVEWWKPFGLAGVRMNGDDVLNVYDETVKAVELARSGGGASVLHFECVRWRGHNLNDAHHLYRTRDEMSEDRSHDPIEVSRLALGEHYSADELGAASVAAHDEVDQAWELALQSSRPNPETVFVGVPG